MNDPVLRKAIAELRTFTTAELLALLQQKGIKGRPNSTQACPIARACNQAFGGRFTIGPKLILHQSRIGSGWSDPVAVETPSVVREALLAFDRLEVPALLDPKPTHDPAKYRKSNGYVPKKPRGKNKRAVARRAGR